MNALRCLVILVFVSFVATAQVRFLPASPQVDQVVSLTYSPQGTGLAADSLIEGRYVRYGAPAVMQLSRPTPLVLTRRGDVFVGEFRLPKRDVAGVMLLFRNSRQPQRADLNNGQLYVIPVCDSTGQPLPHAIGGQASVFTRTHFVYETAPASKPDLNRIIALYDQELARHPDVYPQYWSDYLAALIKQKKPGYGPKVKTAIGAYLKSVPAPSTADLTAAALLYESLGDFKSANLQRERMKTVDPAGSLAQKDRAAAIRNEPNWARRRALYQAYIREFPNSPYAPGLTVLITDGYFKNNDLPGLLTFVETQPPAHTDVLMLNTMAFQLADERRSLPEAEKLVRKAMALLDAQGKPATFRGDWNLERQNRQRALHNTLARALEQQGKDAEAYAAYQRVINPEEAETSDPRTNERYYLCALRTNHATEARPLAEAAVSVGKATPRLKAALHDWYARQPGQNAAKADVYLTELEADLRADQRDELRERLINEPAPAFSLTDLQGRTISSAALRGKVVVLDFWATWCAPCIASFPAMQQAQARFQNDPAVRFLFVNTREGGRVQRVREYMSKNPYPFVVPLDLQQKVSTAYGVLGIPTKVVIGPDGRIRYRAIGYTGTPEATVNEVTLVVELLKEGK